MAGSRKQIDFDWETPFKERMNELRARLRSVEVAVTRLSPLRWGHVTECLMAIWAHTLPTGETQTATSRIMETSGLTRRQYYTALAAAKKIGLVEAVTAYQRSARQSDSLRLDRAALDALLAESRRRRAKRSGPAAGYQRVPAGTSGYQRVTAGNSSAKNTNPRAPAGAALELPKNLSAAANAREEPSQAAAAAEVFLDQSEQEWKAARPIGNRILVAIAPGGLRTLSDERIEWIRKVAVLAVRFGADWIEPAFERLRHAPAHSPQGLMAAILDDECQRLGTRLNRELARVKLPVAKEGTERHG